MKKRVIYIDMLRIFATFAVVFLHSASCFWHSDPNTINWQFANFYDSLVRWCVPMFVMISGVFFLQNGGGCSQNSHDIKSEYKKIISKNIFRIVTALVIWGAAYGALKTLKWYLKGEISGISIAAILKIFYHIIAGIPYYHLWFLYLIIGLYILAPLLKIFVQNATKFELEIFLFLFLTLGVGVNLINALIEIFGKNGFYFSEILPEFGGYIGYFVAGYYFANFDLSKKAKFYLYILAFASVLFTIAGTSVLSLYFDNPVEILYKNLRLNTALITFGIFVFVKTRFLNFNFSQKMSNFIQKLSFLTFGIYLIHQIFLEIFYKIYLLLSKFPNYAPVLIPLIAIVVFVASAICIQILSKISLFRKFAM